MLVRVAPLQKSLVLAESEGGMGQPNLNSISRRASTKEQHVKSTVKP